jgi:membrane-bound lytic murein transglycosylase B
MRDRGSNGLRRVGRDIARAVPRGDGQPTGRDGVVVQRRRAQLVSACAGLGAGLLGGITGAARAQPPPYPARDDVQAFIVEANTTYGLDPVRIERLLGLARTVPEAVRLNTPGQLPGSSRNWVEYRARMLEDRRVRSGVAFAREQAEPLARAAERFGVPAQIVVAIIGIETRFGKALGQFRTLDVLATLSFDYTRRAALYREELMQFFLLCSEQGLDPTEVRSSFAGAIGLPQFMPGSIRRYAVDFDDDGRIDLTRSAADAIGSVANYLAAQGWQRDGPIAFAARVDSADTASELVHGILPAWQWGELAARGVAIDAELDPATPVLLIDLPYATPAGETGTLYRVGTANLAALLHYNRSFLYASAVTDFAEELRRRQAA